MSAKTASPDDIELSSVFGALKKSAAKILLTGLLAGGATYAILSMMAPRFQSQAELAIEAKGSSSFNDPKANPVGPDSASIRVDQAAINTHVKALQSPEILSKIADKLNLKSRAEFNAEVGPVDQVDAVLRLVGVGGPRAGEAEGDRVLNAFRNQLDVFAAKESRYIAVRANSTDPQLSADIANEIVDEYRKRLATQGVAEVDDQQAVLQGKIEKLLPEVAAAETEVERYRGEINVFKGGSQNTGLNEQQLSELTAELTKAKAARGEADARAKSAREMMKLGSADALPDVQKSPLIQNLVQQRVRIERQISELSATLLPGHPRMQQLNGDLAGLKRQLNGEVSKLVDSLEKEARVAQGREDSIKKSLDDIKAKVVTNAPEEAKLRQLEGAAKGKRAELENMQQQLEASRKKLDPRAQAVEAQIISKAQPVSVPVFPKKLPWAGLVALAAMMLGVVRVLLKVLFQSARGGGTAPQGRRASDRATGQRAEPVLASQPKSSAPAVAAAAATATATAAAAAPAEPAPLASAVPVADGAETDIDNLAARLMAARPAEGGHRSLITGETEAADPSAVAVDAAKAVAARGPQVMLIEWSPSGRPVVKLQGARPSKGLAELLAGSVRFEDIVDRIPGSAVHFIASGAALDSVLDDIEPDQINLVLDALDEAYEHIIVVGNHEDARLLFEAIQGRFDAGVIVTDPKKRPTVLQDPEGTFLGFDVADIDVIRFSRVASGPSAQRIVRATRGSGSELRPV